MTSNKKNRLWIWIAGIFGSLILILGFAAIFINSKWKPLLTEKIKQGVYNGSQHLYNIDFKDLNINVLTGSIALHNVTLIPDHKVFDSLKVKHLAPAHLFKINLKKLQVSHVGLFNAYFKKQVEVGEIRLDKPSINMTLNKVYKEVDTIKPEKTLYQQISQTFKLIHVKTIKVVDADFDYIKASEPKKAKNTLKHVDITIKDFLLDSLSNKDTTRFYYTKDVSFQVAGYKSQTKDKMYNMKIDTIRGASTTKNITLKGLKLTPKYPELTFARKYKTQKDRYNLDFKQIEFIGVDFILLNTDQKLKAKSLIVGPAKVEVFMSRESLPSLNLDKGKNFPHQALKRLDFPITIDVVKLKKVEVKYSEYNPASKKIGSVTFNAITGNILNVTNDSLALIKNNHALADFNTKLMGKSRLNLNIDFNLTDKNAAFTYGGSMNNFNMQLLNPLSKALGLVEIETGNIEHIDFKAVGNLRSASGNLHMQYHNLKVKLLSDNINGKGTKEKGFLSFLANTILVKNENPEKGEAQRTATMSNERINSASFFNLMWKTVFVGIKDIVGVGIIPEKNPVEQQKKVIKKIKDQKIEENKKL
ncbi:hypothetical protein [Pedobacter mucosus]|uniref:hypothetical protein n=1 Tax=Pedobacter mucosus TaxID=2895286 RepID=UPI001EE455EE|nr:hypothetical protein [Pedobacter mucosus]UKT63469.1 hypothetical protein LOK61_17075 [Pedobacter mucosus]